MDNVKIVASHQPHFFPWLGYFAKMAKSNIFLINDIAQFEKKSPMQRNRIIDRNGNEKYINVIIDKTDYMHKENRAIAIKDWADQRESLIGKIKDAYLKTDGFEEVWPSVKEVLLGDYNKLIELNIQSILLGRSILGINTPMRFHSEYNFDIDGTTSEKLAQKLSLIGTDVYYSGVGAKKYMNEEDFSKYNIDVVYQNYKYPQYFQPNTMEFIPNMSFLDIAFCCGIEKTRQLFWDSIFNCKDL